MKPAASKCRYQSAVVVRDVVGLNTMVKEKPMCPLSRAPLGCLAQFIGGTRLSAMVKYKACYPFAGL